MDEAQKTDPVIKPLDQHASGEPAEPQDQHASGGTASTQDQHASGEPV